MPKSQIVSPAAPAATPVPAAPAAVTIPPVDPVLVAVNPVNADPAIASSTSSIGDSATQRLARIVVFFGVYICLIAIYVAIVTTARLGRSDFSGPVMQMLASSYSIITAEWPAVGAIAPALIAGVVVLTAAPRRRTMQVLSLLVLTIVIFGLYLDFQMFLGADNINEMIGSEPPSNNPVVKARLVSFSSDVRNFMGIIFGSLLGLQIGKLV